MLMLWSVIILLAPHSWPCSQAPTCWNMNKVCEFGAWEWDYHIHASWHVLHSGWLLYVFILVKMWGWVDKNDTIVSHLSVTLYTTRSSSLYSHVCSLELTLVRLAFILTAVLENFFTPLTWEQGHSCSCLSHSLIIQQLLTKSAMARSRTATITSQ